MTAIDITGWDPGLLPEAISVWTGWGHAPCPTRNGDQLVARFGADLTGQLIRVLRFLEQEFYSSDARHAAANLIEMGAMAREQFSARFPTVPDDAVQALAWCYKFDFK